MNVAIAGLAALIFAAMILALFTWHLIDALNDRKIRHRSQARHPTGRNKQPVTEPKEMEQ